MQNQLLILPDKNLFNFSHNLVIIKPFYPLPCLPPIDPYLLIGVTPESLHLIAAMFVFYMSTHRKKDGSPLFQATIDGYVFM
jgi:hypothetical protein